jgi:predicted nucleic acid-binding protein
MTSYVLDASVAVAWYLPETFAAPARRFRDRLARTEIRCVVPGLHYWELGNVLRTYVRRGEIESSLAREIFDLHLDAELEVAEPDRRRVLEVALEYEATVYDAVYIALALDADLRLLTAERTTTPWVVRLGDRVTRVEAS